MTVVGAAAAAVPKTTQGVRAFEREPPGQYIHLNVT